MCAAEVTEKTKKKMFIVTSSQYSDTSANEDNSFRNHIRQPKPDFPQVSIENCLIRSGCCPLFKDQFYKIVKSTLLKVKNLPMGEMKENGKWKEE